MKQTKVSHQNQQTFFNNDNLLPVKPITVITIDFPTPEVAHVDHIEITVNGVRVGTLSLGGVS